jgi:DEAD/DEAH box helicase domain-containing protein
MAAACLLMLTPLLSRWRSDPSIAGNIVEWKTIPPRHAHLVPLPSELHPSLANSLIRNGIRDLYSHQAEAYGKASLGSSLVVVTGTASGKSLCYNLPVLDSVLKDGESGALYLFPTKALAQDQRQGIASLNPSPEKAPFGVYDGDTPSAARPGLRAKARIILSNPDMLHAGILAHHTIWADFFSRLKYVVIDEIHIYRGVFGSHVANVLRRLKRIARFYGSDPQFILTSATIANPAQLAEWLVETPVELIDEDGSARGLKHFLIYNPPLIDPDLGLRRSLIQESVRLAEDLIAGGVQSIIFARTRRTVELILSYLRNKAVEDTSKGIFFPTDEKSFRGYRSGYLPRQRREIESGLKEGAVRAVVATTALELGIDIGRMGASLLAGYPGTIAAAWQQAGRSGRGQEASLSVLVTSANPLDQFLARYPDYFFGRSPEQALINPDNLLILLAHLRCAAFELPFTEREPFGSLDASLLLEFLDYLKSEGVLHHSGNKYYWMADHYPAERVSLRSASPDPVILQAENEEDLVTIGQVDLPSAPWMVHPGAVYMHEASSYLVESLDLENRTALLKPAELDYFTNPKNETTVQLVEKFSEEETSAGLKGHGEVNITTQVTGYKKVKLYTHETLGYGEVTLPPSELLTTGYWLSLSDSAVQRLKEKGLWRNEPNDYGPDWHVQRSLARSRDDFRCQVCGAPESGREHDVHHKIPFRMFRQEDYRVPVHEAANQLSNLITLCPACHHKVELNVRVSSGLSGLAFVLGNLAPLFLMCDSRDIGIHHDPKAQVADGQPAVILFDMVPAGLGFSEKLYEIHDELVGRALELIETCPCSDGCPSCTGPGGESGLGGKAEALAILQLIRGDENGFIGISRDRG